MKVFKLWFSLLLILCIHSLMYIWAISERKELGCQNWKWVAKHGEIFGTYLECWVEFKYPITIATELEQKGVHTFWVGPNPPPPPPAPRGACLGVEPHLPPEPYDFGKDGWETYYSYYYTIF
ncbi:MAG: hypothetical protein ABIK78_05780 [candidate division WOR-3 bacterium]|uniref:Uncharacterized protein n=1 Tax=candidate division WOR-3 bacterium TaxID=2052148 RepID=A0A7V4FDD6_UNCW3